MLKVYFSFREDEPHTIDDPNCHGSKIKVYKPIYIEGISKHFIIHKEEPLVFEILKPVYLSLAGSSKRVDDEFTFSITMPFQKFNGFVADLKLSPKGYNTLIAVVVVANKMITYDYDLLPRKEQDLLC